MRRRGLVVRLYCGFGAEGHEPVEDVPNRDGVHGIFVEGAEDEVEQHGEGHKAENDGEGLSEHLHGDLPLETWVTNRPARTRFMDSIRAGLSQSRLGASNCSVSVN